MRIIDHRDTDPYFNLAAEEYLFGCLPATETACMLWQNRPVVVVGKHQDVESEVNRPFAEANRIGVARRFSGGGAVYHDLGNLNLTFIGRLGEDSPEGFTQWLAGFLRRLGIPVEGDARLALFVKGLKISGSAQYVRRDRFLHHATLLFSTDLDRLVKVLDASYGRALPAALSVSPASQAASVSAISSPFSVLSDASAPSASSATHVLSASSATASVEVSPGRNRRLFTRSVKSPVANLSDFLPSSYTLETFRQCVLKAWAEGEIGPAKHPCPIVRKDFDGPEKEAIKRLRNEKYANGGWIASTYPL